MKKLFLCFSALALISNMLVAQISGTKTIGATGDYATFTDAIAAMYASGISGNVIFSVEDGTYNEKLVLTDTIAGTDFYTVTFQSASKDSSKVTIKHVASGNKEYLVELTSTENLLFKHLSFELEGNYSCRIMKLNSGIRNFWVENCSFKLADDNPHHVELKGPSFSDSTSHDINFTNNLFLNGYEAIVLEGGYYGWVKNVEISNNVFDNQRNNAVDLLMVETVTVANNKITTSGSTNDDISAFGIGLELCKNYVISKNRIYSSFGTGIFLYQCKNEANLNSLVSNNFISTIVLTFSGYGIWVKKCDFVDVVYNSVKVVKDDNGWSSAAGKFDESTNLNIVNNIFQNKNAQGIHLDDKNGLIKCDYNCYLGKEGDFAMIGDDWPKDFAKWQSLTGLDSNSVSGDVGFKSGSDLHVNSILVHNAGTPFSPVFVDIDGEERDQNTPDIGADEFEIKNEKPVVADQVLRIQENPSASDTIGTIVATDADTDQILTYSIIAGNDTVVALDSLTGTLTVSMPDFFNFETVSSTTITVKVEDNGEVPMMSTANVTINILDVNEAPIAERQVFSVLENPTDNQLIGTVLATDPDNGQTLSFSIIETSLEHAVAINEQTGELTVSDLKLFDAEANTNITLKVKVTDSDATPLSTEVEVIIYIDNIDELPTMQDQEFAIDENSELGTIVGVVEADLGDGYLVGFTIESQSVEGAFAIEAETGTIVAASTEALDFETNPEIVLEVQVMTMGLQHMAANANITVKLNDLVETNIVDAELASLKMYPNPAKGELFVMGNTNNVLLEAYSANGALLLKQDLAQSKSIVIDNYKGLVIIKLTNGFSQKVQTIVIE